MHQSIPWDTFVVLFDIYSKSTLGWLCYLSYPFALEQVEKLFLQNEGGKRDGLELQKGRKQGVATE